LASALDSGRVAAGRLAAAGALAFFDPFVLLAAGASGRGSAAATGSGEGCAVATGGDGGGGAGASVAGVAAVALGSVGGLASAGWSAAEVATWSVLVDGSAVSLSPTTATAPSSAAPPTSSGSLLPRRRSGGYVSSSVDDAGAACGIGAMNGEATTAAGGGVETGAVRVCPGIVCAVRLRSSLTKGSTSASPLMTTAGVEGWSFGTYGFEGVVTAVAVGLLDSSGGGVTLVTAGGAADGVTAGGAATAGAAGA
jgi:hypothetical protein